MREVSLYIPCFNAAETIRFCLEGVLKQTYRPKEILVIDDGSTDESANVVSKFPVRLIRHNDNLGLAAARNTAIRNIKTEFIASLDADCLAECDWLKLLMAGFGSSRAGGVGGRVLEKHSSVFDLWRSVHMKQHWGTKIKHPQFLFGSNTVFRRETLIKVKLYNEVYKNNYEDVDICQRIKKKGYSLIYEHKAVAWHLKKDNISSLLDTYWRWNLAYYQKRGYYANQKRLILKIKDNIGLANRYLVNDLSEKRNQLLYLDFLLPLHISFRDFEYFISKDTRMPSALSSSQPIFLWLSLLDLTFVYHFNSGAENISTFIPKNARIAQNLFALNLVLSKLIQEKFKSRRFQNILSKDLLLSTHRIHNHYLLDILKNLRELHKDWGGLLEKRQPNINNFLLLTISAAYKKWLEGLIYFFPDITRMIEEAAKNKKAPISK